MRKSRSRSRNLRSISQKPLAKPAKNAIFPLKKVKKSPKKRKIKEILKNRQESIKLRRNHCQICFSPQISENSQFSSIFMQCVHCKAKFHPQCLGFLPESRENDEKTTKNSQNDEKTRKNSENNEKNTKNNENNEKNAKNSQNGEKNCENEENLQKIGFSCELCKEIPKISQHFRISCEICQGNCEKSLIFVKSPSKQWVHASCLFFSQRILMRSWCFPYDFVILKKKIVKNSEIPCAICYRKSQIFDLIKCEKCHDFAHFLCILREKALNYGENWEKSWNFRSSALPDPVFIKEILEKTRNSLENSLKEHFPLVLSLFFKANELKEAINKENWLNSQLFLLKNSLFSSKEKPEFFCEKNQFFPEKKKPGFS